MKRLGNLFSEATSFKNLLLASKKAFRGKKLRGNVAPFFFNLENEIIRLQTELVSGSYAPKGYQTFEIHEPKARQI